LHVNADDVALIRVNALAVAASQFLYRDPQVDFAITGDVLAVPALHLVKQRDGRANHIRALLGQQPAKSRIAHRRASPIPCAVAKILGDRGAELIAIEPCDRTTCCAQPAAQFPPNGCLAGAG
jgi:hypothetical protein